jgi:hypothetical protein
VTDEPEHPADPKPIDPAQPTEDDPKVIKTSEWGPETEDEERK